MFDYYNKKKGRPSKEELAKRKLIYGLKIKEGKFILSFD